MTSFARATLLLVAATSAVAEDRVLVERFDGQTLEGVLVACDDSLVAVETADGVLELPVREVVSIRVVDATETESPRNVVVIANGDRLVGRPLDADEDTLRLDVPSSAEPLAVPLETIRGVAWSLSLDRNVRETTLADLGRVRGDGDRLVSTNGDFVLGEFRGLSEEGVELVVSTANTTVPGDRVRALSFDPTLITPPKTPKRHVLVRLNDGTRLTAATVAVDDAIVSVEAAFGPTIDVPRERLQSLRFVGGRARDLSDREPATFEHTPWLGPKRDWKRDRAVTGHPMRLSGVTHDKGLGLPSGTRLVYDLQPGDRTFHGHVGIDDSTRRRGSARVVVSLDGREVHRTPVVRGGEKPVAIPPTDVAGAKQLELRVDPADDGDLLDRVNLIDLLVVGE